METYFWNMVVSVFLFALAVGVIFFFHKRRVDMYVAADMALINLSFTPLLVTKQMDFRLCCEFHKNFYSDKKNGIWYYWKDKVGPGNGKRVFYWGSLQGSAEADFFIVSEKNSYLHWNIPGNLGIKEPYKNYVYYSGDCSGYIDRLSAVYSGDDVSVEVHSGMLLVIFYVEPFDADSVEKLVELTSVIGSVFGEQKERSGLRK